MTRQSPDEQLSSSSGVDDDLMTMILIMTMMMMMIGPQFNYLWVLEEKTVHARPFSFHGNGANKRPAVCSGRSSGSNGSSVRVHLKGGVRKRVKLLVLQSQQCF